jgi:4-amino-4-deoxy-L-arabinose transferase-like glycosyltransferase
MPAGQVSTNATASAQARRSLSAWLLACLALFVVIHGALLAHDVRHPEAFYDGDRADKRANKIFVLLDVPELRKVSSPKWSSVPAQPFGAASPRLSLTEKLLNQGPPGDYLVHALPYWLGGQYAVIITQLALALIAVVCVFRLGLRLGLNEVYAFAATAIYILLPGSLFQPHELVSEGLFNPLLAIATYLLVRLVEEPFRWRIVLTALVLIAIAMQVRTQLLLYPFVLVAIFLYWRRDGWPRLVIATLVICFAIPVAWSIFVALQPDELVTAPTELSLARNLSGLVERMAIRGGFAFDRTAYPGEEMPLSEFLGYLFRYPLAFIQIKLTDATEILANPGITGLGKYLGIDLFTFKTGTGKLFWAQMKWNAGLPTIVRELLRQDLAFLVPFLAATAAWLIVLAVALFGAFVLIRDRRIGGAAKAVVLSMLLYNLAIVQVSEMVRVGQRTPVEFAIAILFAIGLRGLLQRRTAAAAVADRPAFGNAASR